MSKRAEEAALKAYPDYTDLNLQKRICYINGYEQAEKDLAKKAKYSSGWDGFYYGKGYEQARKELALTWEDIAKIITIYEAGIDNGDYRRYNEAEWMKEYSQDILHKFNKMKYGKSD